MYDDWNTDHRRWLKRCLLIIGDHIFFVSYTYCGGSKNYFFTFLCNNKLYTCIFIINPCSLKWQYLHDVRHAQKHWGLVIGDWYFEGRMENCIALERDRKRKELWIWRLFVFPFTVCTNDFWYIIFSIPVFSDPLLCATVLHPPFKLLVVRVCFFYLAPLQNRAVVTS